MSSLRRANVSGVTALRLTVVLAIAMVLAVACGSPEGQALSSSRVVTDTTVITAMPATFGGSTYFGPIPRAVSYGGDTGITLAVPPKGVSPSVSWQSAVRNCSTCEAGAPVSISLALATELQAGQAKPDGSIAPVMDKTLVYVLSQSLQCRAAGPAGATPAVSGTYACVRLSFVDARMDKDLYAVDGADLWDPGHVR